MIPNLPSYLERILTAGNRAPSGENCQPWHFVVRNMTVEIHLLPDRDQSAYNWGQRGSYLALGAAIENILIEASTLNYRATVTYFPIPGNFEHVASITLQHDKTVRPDSLAASISRRVTNRRPYAKDVLTAREQEALRAAVHDTQYGSLHLAADRDALKALGRIGSTNEEVMLTNESLHHFFFDHINWTKKEDDQKSVGFYIKTLELPPPVEGVFKAIQHWPLMQALNIFRFNAFVAFQNGMVNASASAIGALTTPGTDPLDFVKIGRTVERLWLTATAHDLALQPLTGIFFFQLKLQHHDEQLFSQTQRDLVSRACDRAAALLGVKGEHIAFMFRVGHASPPSAQASRFPLEKVVTVVA